MSDTNIYCRRCGSPPGEKSTCTGTYTAHDFRSSLIPQSKKKDSLKIKDTRPLRMPIDNASTPTRDSEPMVSILFMAADPTDASRLRLGEEFRVMSPIS